MRYMMLHTYIFRSESGAGDSERLKGHKQMCRDIHCWLLSYSGRMGCLVCLVCPHKHCMHVSCPLTTLDSGFHVWSNQVAELGALNCLGERAVNGDDSSWSSTSSTACLPFNVTPSAQKAAVYGYLLLHLAGKHAKVLQCLQA